MSSIVTSNVTSGFVDLATFDEIEKYMYGGKDATAYFVRETRKATWFTQVPVVLSRTFNSPAFGVEWSAGISRAGDYLLQSWLRLTLPAVTLRNTNRFGTDGRIRWTRNFMHSIIEDCNIQFNDLTAARFDNFHLDFWTAFTVPASKRNGYDNMIGNTSDLTGPQANALPSRTLNLPLPFFYSHDSGVALPTAALPYNEMRIVFKFRDWNQLLLLDNVAAADGTNPTVVPDPNTDLLAAPVLSNVQVWANYAIVSNDERQRMACAARDILIEQVQSTKGQDYLPNTQNPRFDVRFSHSIKAFFFGVRNRTKPNEWANYTAACPVPGETAVNFTPELAVDPIAATSLIYENTARLAQMGSDYYSLINPYYNAPAIPSESGYHMYSYALDLTSLDPLGSTNFGKLTNVSVIPEPGAEALVGFNGTGGAGSGADFPQRYEFVITAINHNIIRIAGGALGFPVL